MMFDICTPGRTGFLASLAFAFLFGVTAQSDAETVSSGVRAQSPVAAATGSGAAGGAGGFDDAWPGRLHVLEAVVVLAVLREARPSTPWSVVDEGVVVLIEPSSGRRWEVTDVDWVGVT